MTTTIIRYLPNAWQDEVIPEPQESPDAFIHFDKVEGWVLRPCGSAEDDEEEDDIFYVKKIRDGDIIAFDENQVFGDFILTVCEDGTFSTDRPVPDKANCFRKDRDIETLASSICELVTGSGFMGDPLEPGTHEIDAYWWSQKPVYFRFCVDAAGKARFEPCAGPT